jgi:hypothetical protein
VCGLRCIQRRVLVLSLRDKKNAKRKAAAVV